MKSYWPKPGTGGGADSVRAQTRRQGNEFVLLETPPDLLMFQWLGLVGDNASNNYTMTNHLSYIVPGWGGAAEPGPLHLPHLESGGEGTWQLWRHGN